MPQVTVEESFAGGIKARTEQRAKLHKHDYTAPATLSAEWESIWTRCNVRII